MELRLAAATEAIEVLRVIEASGYEISVQTRTDLQEIRQYGTHVVTRADQLRVQGGDGPLREPLVSRIREHQPYLLAAACVRRPPMAWLRHLVARARKGQFPVVTLCAHVASFCGRHPHDGLVLEDIIRAALGGRRP
jgi:hypothetical protein